MVTSIVSADSLLAVDVGTTSTRVFLFDVVDGRYHFIASGSSPTTASMPHHDVGEGLRWAFSHLEDITGRTLFRADGSLIIPSGKDGSGVDTFAATMSAGPPLKVIVVGLLESVSVESAQRLADTTYAQVVKTLSLNDRRQQEERIDAILSACPDIVIITGGTEGGASQSLRKLIEAVGLACYLMPEKERPHILFAGNQELRKEVQSSLGSLAQIHIAPNLRPTLETEQLEPAQTQMANIFRHVRARQIMGVSQLNVWSEDRLLPSVSAFGRVIRFLSRVYDPNKGVLGINVGSSTTTLVSAFSGNLDLGVYPQLGLGYGALGLLEHNRLEDITRWVTIDLPQDVVRDYIYNKSVYPSSLPTTQEGLAIEYAMLRQAIRTAVNYSLPRFPTDVAGSGPGLLPQFEPIIASGAAIANAPSYAQAMLALLDGLQPTGVTTLVLDQNDMAPVLGAAAGMNPALAVQLLESNAFLNLGTVVSPLGRAHLGAPVLRLRVVQESGDESSIEVKFGTLKVIPIPSGQAVQLRLRPLNRFDVGMGGPGVGGRLRVVGGALGVVIDARGRPLALSKDPGRRRQHFSSWLEEIESRRV
ncbi:MAG: glutamate mutase L [Anaerolineales bacterium]|jgi:hypothetical protein